MINLELALGSFWQLARHWKMGDTAKLELSCEGGNLQLNFSAKLGHPDNQHFRKEELPTSSTPPPSTSPPASCKRKTPSQLRRQDRRRLAALDKAASVQAALDKATADKAAAEKATAEKAASEKAIAEKTKAEKANVNTAVPEAAAVKATATQAVAVKPSDRSSVLRFAAKQDNVGSAKVKAKVTLAANKELAGPALAAAAKALGPNTSYREMCVEAQKIAKSVEEIDAIAALWKTYTRQMARAKKCH